MNLKKKLGKLLSFLLLLALSVTLFTGCTQEDAEFAVDVLTTMLETEVEEDVYEDTVDSKPVISENGTYTSASVNVLVAAQAIQVDGFSTDVEKPATAALNSGFAGHPWPVE